MVQRNQNFLLRDEMISCIRKSTNFCQIINAYKNIMSPFIIHLTVWLKSKLADKKSQIDKPVRLGQRTEIG